MKRLILILLIGIISFATLAQSQIAQQQPKQTQEMQVIKPVFYVSDVYVVLTILDGVDIQGKEVEAYLDVKKNINSYLEMAKEKNLKVTDTIKVDMPLYVAQNTVSFLSRASIKGSMADQYKRFIDSMVEASKTAK